MRATVPEPPVAPDALLTAEEVGELLQLSPRTLKDQAAAGVLPHHRFGKHYRFTRADVAEIVRLSAAPGPVSGGPATSVRTGRGGALIRRNLWLDPRDGQTRLGDFAEEWLEAVAPRLELNTISTILNGAVRARMIPANPCNGVRVSMGEFDTERLVATPAQTLRPRCGSTSSGWASRGSCCA